MFPSIPLPGLPFGLPTYGLMVAAGFLVALWLAERLARRSGFPEHVVQDTAVWACIAGLVGAKLALLIVEPPRSWKDVVATIFQGGIFYGGFVGALGAMLFLAWKRRMDVHALTDVLAAPAAIGHVFGRIGCFLAGCCFGTHCEAPWAVHYSNPDSMPVQSGILPSFGLHPVQLYEAAGNLALAGLALFMLPRRRFTGQAGWTYVAAYGALRFAVEHWRGDERGTIGPFSTSQAVGLLAVAVGLSMLAWRARAARPSPAGPAGTALPPATGP
jgi:phosphatidylglycerol---prolipoprotein diacylglyceryl transferase